MLRNKFVLPALLWPAAAVYGLLRRELGTPPFGALDTVTVLCAAVAFVETFLLAKAFAQDGKTLPFSVPLLVGMAVTLLRLLRNCLLDLPPWHNGLPAAAAAALSAAFAAYFLYASRRI